MSVHQPLVGTPATLTAQEKREAKGAIYMKEVERLQSKLAAFSSDLSGVEPVGTWSKQAEWSALEFLECLGLVFDVNAQADMDHLRSELGIDDEGYRLDADGERGDRVHTPARRIGL
jgi:hypothetical protein